ncbi:MAG: hypothetical protein ACRER2_05380 [Methylococcales bacterium]
MVPGNHRHAVVNLVKTLGDGIRDTKPWMIPVHSGLLPDARTSYKRNSMAWLLSVRHSLVLRPRDNGACSVPVVFRSKAHRAGKGHALVKRCNAAAGHHGRALRVSLSASMDCVTPLGKASSIPGEARLAMNADKLTASVIIAWTEYWWKTTTPARHSTPTRAKTVVPLE